MTRGGFMLNKQIAFLDKAVENSIKSDLRKNNVVESGTVISKVAFN